MSPVDLGLVLVALLAVVLGLYTGVLRVVMALVGLAVGLWVAIRFTDPFAELLLSWVKFSEPAARLVAAACLLTLTLSAAALVTWLIVRSLKVFRLGWVDRVSGGLIGLLIMAVTTGFVAVNLGVDAQGEATIGGSCILPVLVQAFEQLQEWLGAGSGKAATRAGRSLDPFLVQNVSRFRTEGSLRGELALPSLWEIDRQVRAAGAVS